MPVNWGSSLVVEAQSAPCTHDVASSRMWAELCRPEKTAQLVGNAPAKQKLREWFAARKACASGNACLVVNGPSGVGKSTAVDLCAREGGFRVEHTYANTQRTPAKLESIQRRITMYPEKTVLVLDDFESFIYETTSMRDVIRFARGVAVADNTGDQTLVVVCNGMDKTFRQLFSTSTVVEFEAPNAADVQAALRRVSKIVSPFANVPPMDIFFIAHGSMGNIYQTINQVQLSYSRSIRRKASKPGQKRQPRRILGTQAHTDSPLQNWATTHRSSSIDCFTKTGQSVMGYICTMSKGFHLDVRDNLHREYPFYFHNSTPSTLHQMWLVADSVSACDINAPDEEDSLYETENRELWGRDNSFAVAHVSCGIWRLQGRQREVHALKKRKIKTKFTAQR